jgi:two-component system, OmpR family, sensor histidine kinase CiaH
MSLKEKRLAIATAVYWFLLLYIIAALVWWFIALQTQNHLVTNYKLMQLKPDDPEYPVKANNIRLEEYHKTERNIGEGSTFMLVILVGAIFVYRAVRRQIKLQQQQQNFMMAITHELKTPIAVAKLNMETLQKHNLEEQQRQKFINAALQETNRLNTLANNILVASQLESGRHNLSKEELDFSALAQNIAEDLAKRFSDRKWIITVEPEIFLTGDGLLLQMLVSNLGENAVKYSPKNSKITVSLKKTNSRIVFAVKDEGPGIPQPEKKKVFEKFYRIGNEETRSAPGTGLGLYLCKKIADDHKAQINVSDNSPRGSIFTVIL